jgi:hypothetical protein
VALKRFITNELQKIQNAADADHRHDEAAGSPHEHQRADVIRFRFRETSRTMITDDYWFELDEYKRASGETSPARPYSHSHVVSLGLQADHQGVACVQTVSSLPNLRMP